MKEGRPYPAKNNARGDQQLSEALAPVADVVEYVRRYAREKPEVAALWCLGIGFVLGWKLKPW